MLATLSYCVQTVFPTFILVFLGQIAVCRNMVSHEFIKKLSRICFQFFLPMQIFLDIVQADLNTLRDFRLPGFALVVTLLIYGLLWLTAKLLVRPREDAGTFVHVGFRSSFTVLGLAMVRSIGGEEGVARCTGLLTMVVVLYNILAVLCLTQGRRTGEGKKRMLHTVRTILTNPLILGVEAAVLLKILGWELPQLLLSPIESMGSIAIPLSLLCVGASLDLSRLHGNLKNTVLAALCKTAFQAILAIPLAVFVGFRGIELAAVAILFTSANPSACYVMTESMGGNSDLAAASVVLSTLLSVFTVTCSLYILKAFQFI